MDVVRHRLVSEIVDAYARNEEPDSGSESGGAAGVWALAVADEAAR